jgi:hypothetical protein
LIRCSNKPNVVVCIFLLITAKYVSQDGNNRKSNNLKIVCSGTKEFERARVMRDLYLEFAEHQVRLHKKLASMEVSEI